MATTKPPGEGHDEEAGHRGWISPGERGWMHPSELPGELVGTRRRATRARRLSAICLLVLATALAVTGFTMLSKPAPLPSSAQLAKIRPSIAQLSIQEGGHHQNMLGIISNHGWSVAVAGLSPDAELRLVRVAGQVIGSSAWVVDPVLGVGTARLSRRMRVTKLARALDLPRGSKLDGIAVDTGGREICGVATISASGGQWQASGTRWSDWQARSAVDASLLINSSGGILGLRDWHHGKDAYLPAVVEVSVANMLERHSPQAWPEASMGLTLSQGSRGPYVKALSPSGPADRSLRLGDQILSVNNMTISSPAQFFSGVLSAQGGDFASLDLVRAGKTLRVKIKLVAMPEALAAQN